MSATEEVLEQIPEAVLEDSAELVMGMRNNPWLLLGVSLVAGSIGAFSGYKLAQKRLKTYYEDLAQKEIEEAKVYYSHLRKDGDAADPEKLLGKLHPNEIMEDAAKAHRMYAGHVEHPADSEEELLSPEERHLHGKNDVSLEREPIQEKTRQNRRHTFERSVPVENDTFNYDAELAYREANPDKPYVITHDEYYENEKDYEQTHLTYWQGDDVLADEREQPIPDESIVGEDNLTRFGSGSKDANIVFVRNDNLQIDFEITRSFGKFSEEVMGFDSDDDTSLKHSERHREKRRFNSWED